MQAFVEPTAPAGEKARPGILVRAGRLLFHHRNLLFPLVLVALLAGVRPAPPAEGEVDWLNVWGLAVALAGQSLRVAVIGYAYIKRGGKNRQVYAAKLVTEGFFAHCRNPLYLGNLIVLLGLFMIHGHPWVYALGGAFFLFGYSAIVAAEEDYLRGKFGESYVEYCRRVSRWLPDFRGLRRSLEGMRFDWRRVVVKEYGSAYAWTVGAVLLLVYERSELTAATLATAGIALGLLTAGWIAARYYKKRVLGTGSLSV
jgi:protein-S-isoprenylcysteine O-methyltransferase Ste14